MVIEAVPLAELSAWLAACTVTLRGFGKSAGATYNPALVIVPTVELPPATLLTLQLTAVLDVPVTIAVNCCGFPRSTLELDDDTDTVTEGGGGGGGVDVPPPHPLVAI